MPILTIILLIINLALLAFIIFKLSDTKKDDQLERTLREELSNSRRELTQNFESITNQFLKLTQMNEEKLERLREVIQTNLITGRVFFQISLWTHAGRKVYYQESDVNQCGPGDRRHRARP